VKTVICNRPNASELINGITFIRGKDDSVAATMSDEEAKQFEDFPGYIVADNPKAAKAAADEAAAAAKAEADAAAAAKAEADKAAQPPADPKK